MTVVRTMAWSALVGGVVAVGLACSPDRTPRIPADTPDCEATCDAAWPCGGVLENDIATCKAECDEEEHGEYRLCIERTACEEMYVCKVDAPSGGNTTPPEDTDP